MRETDHTQFSNNVKKMLEYITLFSFFSKNRVLEASGGEWSVVKMRFTILLKGNLSSRQPSEVPRQPQNL